MPSDREERLIESALAIIGEPAVARLVVLLAECVPLSLSDITALSEDPHAVAQLPFLEKTELVEPISSRSLVRYRLTPKGESLRRIYDAIGDWARRWSDGHSAVAADE